MGLYKMILVDDEEDVRISIEKKVDWNALGFEVVGSASNGEEALELAEQQHVDVVLTDIKMPFMDGLTLCAKLKENYKNTKVVLYSGFDDFEFAREAVHLKAVEYLLKPIGAKDLENVFRKIKENLDKEFSERLNLEKLNSYYQKSLPIMKEQLLVGILDGKLEEEQAETMLSSFEMDFLSPYYCVSVLRWENTNSEKEFRTGQMFMISFMNLTKEYLEDNMKSHVFIYLGQLVVIAQMQDSDEVQDFVYHINQVCKMAFRMLEMHIDAGIGNIYPQLSRIAASYQEAKTALDYRILGDENEQVVYIHDVEPASSDVLYSEVLGISKVMHSMKFGTEKELEGSIEELVLELSVEYKATIQQCQLVLMEMVTEMLKLLRNYQLDISEMDDRNLSLYQEIGSLHSIGELEAWLKKICFGMRELIYKKRSHTANAMTEKAKEYIEQNYSVSGLSVEDLCKYLNVSATYLSVMFKKQVGMSFVSYLTKVRLEHAVELLDTTEDKSYIIAEKVGYVEANYFSYVFKKQYGISPSKYRMNKEK